MGPAGRDGRVAASSRAWRWAALLAVSLLLVPGAFGTPPGHAPDAELLPSAAVTSLSVSGDVFVNGRPAANATQPAVAIPVTFRQPVDVVVNWSARGGKFGTPSSVVIGYARTSILLLGVPSVTREVDESPPTPATSGSVVMTLDFSASSYLVEGLYLASTVLVAANGTTLLAQSYYLRATAPYHLTLLAVGLVVLAAYELVDLAGLLRGRPLQSSRRNRRRPPVSRAKAARRGAVSGAILGLIAVVGAQQLALLDLGPFPSGLEWVVAGAVVGAAILAGTAAALGGRRGTGPGPGEGEAAGPDTPRAEDGRDPDERPA